MAAISWRNEPRLNTNLRRWILKSHIFYAHWFVCVMFKNTSNDFFLRKITKLICGNLFANLAPNFSLDLNHAWCCYWRHWRVFEVCASRERKKFAAFNVVSCDDVICQFASFASDSHWSHLFLQTRNWMISRLPACSCQVVSGFNVLPRA